MEEALLDQAPIWSDLTTFDGAPWRGRVDLITAGFPCQPFSAAGSQLGLDDHRWIWPDIARIIGEVGPRYVFLENVPGVLKHGGPAVLSDLDGLGFDAEWGMLSASAVGAPHRRERWWCLAHPGGARREGAAALGAELGHAAGGGAALGYPGGEGRSPVTRGVDGAQGPDAGWSSLAADEPAGAGQDDGRRQLGDADGQGLRSIGRREGHEEQDADRHGGARMADPSSVGDAPELGPGAGRPRRDAGPEERGGELHRWPPRRGDDAGWEAWLREAGPEPAVRRVTHGRPPELVESLHAGGNGQVPQVSAAALLALAERAGISLPRW